MKKLILVLSSALLLIGCVADDSTNKQTPRFGEPVSSIPWNQPTDWERAGQLGTMPGMTGSH